MARLSINLFGPLQVTLDGEPVRFESDKVRALLAYLAVEQEGPHRRERLAGLLWPDRPEQAARNNLRHALAVLRAAIRDAEAGTPFLQITRQAIRFSAASDAWVDVAAFTSALRAASSAERETIPLLERAVTQYRGDLLEGFSLPDSAPFEEWALLAREQLRRQALDALHQLATLQEKGGQLEQALAHAWRQTELDPWREEAHLQVMRLLALSGRRSEALAQYETCRQLLADGLGVEPEEQTTATYEKIKAGEIAPLHRSTSMPPHNLPASLVPFVAREAELGEIKAKLQDPACRLLTLVGPGGSGKTRLATEAAAALLSEVDLEPFADGLYFISLAPLQSEDAIVPAVAQSLGFAFSSADESAPEAQPRQQLLEHLRRKRMLLMLDNFEHLLSAADLVADILRTAPGIKVLVTSRARLNARGEFLYAVRGMGLPPQTRDCMEDLEHFASVKLFVQAARRIRPGFQPSGDDLRQIAGICRLVDGLPLAILLAAAWVEVLSPAEIAEEMSGEVHRSLDFLQTDWADVPERQRSIRAVFDHSWSLLTAHQRDAMQALSVFRSSFTRHAAAEVANASLQVLKALVDRSFLQRTPGGRYEIHPLLRQYSADVLDDSPHAHDEALDRHCAYFAAALQNWDADLRGPRQVPALEEMKADSENIRSAWDWAVEYVQVHRIEQAMEGFAWFHWWCGHYQQAEAALQAAVDGLGSRADRTLDAENLRVLAHALAWQSYFSRTLGRSELALQLQKRGLALLDSSELHGADVRAEKALLLRNMGFTRLMSDHEEAARLLNESLELYQQLGNEWEVGETLSFLGSVFRLQGVYAKGEHRFREYLTICRRLGDQAGAAWSLAYLGFIAIRLGRFQEAEHFSRESLATSQNLAYSELTGLALLSLGEALESLARFTRGRAVLEESLAIFEDLGRRGWMAYVQTALARINLHMGQYETACAHAKLGLALAKVKGIRGRIGLALLVLGCVALAEQQYAQAMEYLEKSLTTYAETGHPDDIACATAVSAFAALGLGEHRKARKSLAQALQTAIDRQYLFPVLYSLPALSLLLAQHGQAARAVELYATASRYPLVAKSRWYQDTAGASIEAATAKLPAEAVAEAQARGRALDLQATLVQLLDEL